MTEPTASSCATDAPLRLPSVSVTRRPDPITPEAAANILRKQAELRAARLRGNMHEVHNWIRSGFDARVEQNSFAVGLLIGEYSLRRPYSPLPADSDFIEPKVTPYGATFSLDPADMLHDELWWHEALATCCLIGNDVVLTSRHAFDYDMEEMLGDRLLRVVFGYRALPDGHAAGVLRRHRHIYAVKEVASSDAHDDWIALRLAERATIAGERAPLTIGAAPLRGHAVYTLGHPRGMSMRYTATNERIALEPDLLFRAYLDAYPGSSGSPVFDARTHALVGIVKSSTLSHGEVRVGLEQRYVSRLCLPGMVERATLCVSSRAFESALKRLR